MERTLRCWSCRRSSSSCLLLFSISVCFFLFSYNQTSTLVVWILCSQKRRHDKKYSNNMLTFIINFQAISVIALKACSNTSFTFFCNSASTFELKKKKFSSWSQFFKNVGWSTAKGFSFFGGVHLPFKACSDIPKLLLFSAQAPELKWEMDMSPPPQTDSVWLSGPASSPINVLFCFF